MKNDAYLKRTHRHFQQLFNALCDTVAQQQWPLAQQACHEFCAQLDGHFLDEEHVLYPQYEQASGRRQGPTEVMRYEHDQMRDLMEAMYQAISRQQGQQFAYLAASLQQLLHQHHTKEESILPPFCLPEVVARMAQMGDGGPQGY